MANQDKVDILLLGSGGREHALLLKLAESPLAGKLWVAPGNGGMYDIAERADVDQNSPDAVAAFARENGVGLVVIGPEGGFSPEEAAEAAAAGMKTVSLGARILRTETVAQTVLSCLSYEFET